MRVHCHDKIITFNRGKWVEVILLGASSRRSGNKHDYIHDIWEGQLTTRSEIWIESIRSLEFWDHGEVTKYILL